MTALLTNQNLLKQDPDSYYPTHDEVDYGEPMEVVATITTTQSTTPLSARPVSSMIPFEVPVPVKNVIPSPAVSVSPSPSVPAGTYAVPSIKNTSISTTPASPDVISFVPSHKCPIGKEIHVETDIERHVEISLEKTNSVS